MYFKINVANKQAPGRVGIQYAEGQYIRGVTNSTSEHFSRKKVAIKVPVGKPVDLIIYYSNDPSCRDPSENQCSKTFHNP